MTSLIENFVLCNKIVLSILVLSKCRHEASHKASRQNLVSVQPFSTVRLSVSFKSSNLQYISETIHDQFNRKLCFVQQNCSQYFGAKKMPSQSPSQSQSSEFNQSSTVFHSQIISKFQKLKSQIYY